MTFDDVRKIALAWPEVDDGTSYGTPALKVHKKLLARLKEDGDSLVMPGVPQDEREMLVESRPRVFYFTDHYRSSSDGVDPPVRTRRAPSSSHCCAGTGARSGRRRRRLKTVQNKIVSHCGCSSPHKKPQKKKIFFFFFF